MNKAIHFLDILLWTMGRVESAAASVGPVLDPWGVEGTGAAVLRFKNGALGCFSATDAIESDQMWRVELHGTKGGAVVENGEFRFWRTRNGYKERRIRDDEPLLSQSARTKILFGTGHLKQVIDFVEGIREGRPPTVPAADGRHNIAVLEAIYRSTISGAFEEVTL